jgi:hypothetical protein
MKMRWTLLSLALALQGCAAFEGVLSTQNSGYGAGALWNDAPSSRPSRRASPAPLITPEVELGMDMDEVLRTWGEPVSTAHAGDQNQGNAMWIYPSTGNEMTHGSGARRILYFEGGQVAGWETTPY